MMDTTKQEFEEQVISILNSFRIAAARRPMVNHDGAVSIVNGWMNQIRGQALDINNSSYDKNATQWGFLFTDVGAASLYLLSKMSRLDQFVASRFVEFLYQKHQAYGPKPLLRWGVLGICIRVDSKFQRYINMTNEGMGEACGESIRDTLVDIIGYCVHGIRLQKGELK